MVLSQFGRWAGNRVGIRVGILGGTFDPVHCGHLEIASRAFEEAALERVIFIPAGSPRLKSSEPTATPEHRLAMLKLGCSGRIPGFEVSDIELGQPGPTKTVETLQQPARVAGRGRGAGVHSGAGCAAAVRSVD